MLFSLNKRIHGAQRRNYAGIATGSGSGSPLGSGCYRCGSPPSSTCSSGLPGTQFDEACGQLILNSVHPTTHTRGLRTRQGTRAHRYKNVNKNLRQDILFNPSLYLLQFWFRINYYLCYYYNIGPQSVSCGVTPDKSLRYHSVECNLWKTAELKFTGIFRAEVSLLLTRNDGLLLNTRVSPKAL